MNLLPGGLNINIYKCAPKTCIKIYCYSENLEQLKYLLIVQWKNKL